MTTPGTFDRLVILDRSDSSKTLNIKYASTTHVITREMIDALLNGKVLAMDSGDAAEFFVFEDTQCKTIAMELP